MSQTHITEANAEANVTELNQIVPRSFICPRCDTIFHCNRAEPYCRWDHPSQYHLQAIEWAAEPCDYCETWRQPYMESEQSYEDKEDNAVLLFPPFGILDEQ